MSNVRLHFFVEDHWDYVATGSVQILHPHKGTRFSIEDRPEATTPRASDTGFLSPRKPLPTITGMSHVYKFARGDRVKIVSGKHAGATGTVDSCVFQRSVDYPKDYGAGYHVVLDAGEVVTVRVEQVAVDVCGARRFM